MNPFEIERLGWDQIRGLPLVPDPELGTGRFRIVCSRDLDGEGLEEAEAIGQEVETVVPVARPQSPLAVQGGSRRAQTEFQKSRPSSQSQLWASVLSGSVRRSRSGPHRDQDHAADGDDRLVVALDHGEGGGHAGEGERGEQEGDREARPSRPRAGARRGRPSPTATAAERIAPRVGPMQGVQAIAKAAPATIGPPLPARSIRASTCHSRLSRVMKSEATKRTPIAMIRAAGDLVEQLAVVLEEPSRARSRSGRGR